MALMLLMVSFILEILQRKHNSHKGSLQIEMGDHFGSFMSLSKFLAENYANESQFWCSSFQTNWIHKAVL